MLEAGFEGRIVIPTTFHDILAKMEPVDVSVVFYQNIQLLILEVYIFFNSKVAMPTTVQGRLEFLENGGKRQSRLFTTSDNSLDKTGFVEFIEILTNQLAKYWKDEQKVAVVKLTIQAAKMLAEPSKDKSSYPAMFILLSDLVSYFGKLVFDRLSKHFFL